MHCVFSHLAVTSPLPASPRWRITISAPILGLRQLFLGLRPSRKLASEKVVRTQRPTPLHQGPSGAAQGMAKGVATEVVLRKKIMHR